VRVLILMRINWVILSQKSVVRYVPYDDWDGMFACKFSSYSHLGLRPAVIFEIISIAHHKAIV
jgi:hypothetical protein